jgi:hypothetical protein
MKGKLTQLRIASARDLQIIIVVNVTLDVMVTDKIDLLDE